MKASSSSNSLTTLTIDIDPECIVCLESGLNAQGESVMNPLTLHLCGCRFTVHPKCWTEWVRARNLCPICRRPIMVIRVPQTTEVVEVEEDNFIQKRIFIVFTLFIIIAIVLVIVFIVAK
uniref:RING-type domain-containing protein n=1 Tax=viral metagenome TaxID=1070528 RepID=A0A6C0LQN9_9ZZZZ